MKRRRTGRKRRRRWQRADVGRGSLRCMTLGMLHWVSGFILQAVISCCGCGSKLDGDKASALSFSDVLRRLEIPKL